MRFVETTEAKIFRGDDLAKNSRNLAVKGAVSNNAAVNFDGGTVESGNAEVGRYVIIGGKRYKVVSNTDSSMTLDKVITAADDAVIYPGEGRRRAVRVRLPVRGQGRLTACWISARVPRSS